MARRPSFRGFPPFRFRSSRFPRSHAVAQSSGRLRRGSNPCRACTAKTNVRQAAPRMVRRLLAEKQVEFCKNSREKKLHGRNFFSSISSVPKYKGKNRKAKNRANGKSNKRSKNQQLVLMPFFIIRIRKPAKLNNIPNQKKQRYRSHNYEQFHQGQPPSHNIAQFRSFVQKKHREQRQVVDKSAC